MSKPKRAWAIVSKRGSIEVDTVAAKRADVRDMMTLYDEMTGAKIRRVIVTVAD